MSANGQKQTLRVVRPMSALPPKTDIDERDRHVRYVPKADLCTAAKAAYSITSSACTRSDGGNLRPSAFAVLRLTTSSNLVGCSTGRSVGFWPLMILSK